MDRITASKVFIAIVEQGSMVGASETLGMSRSMVTRYLTEMEKWAAARLLHRSTRSLGLTDAGERVLAECYKLKEIEQNVLHSAVESDATPQGKLRVSCSQFLGEKVLITYVDNFLKKYTKVDIDMFVSNHSVNLVDERIDLAIRITNNLDPNIIARKLGTLNSMVCASPSYLKAHGIPKKLDHLTQHNCLTYSYFGKDFWHFTEDKTPQSVAVSGNFSANDPEVVLKATLRGLGISFQPKFSVLPYLKTKELIELLPKYTPQTLGIYGIYTSRKYLPPSLRIFIEGLSQYFSSLEL